jgi:hypothetical protein
MKHFNVKFTAKNLYKNAGLVPKLQICREITTSLKQKKKVISIERGHTANSLSR